MNKDEPTWRLFKELPEERQNELLEISYLAVARIPACAKSPNISSSIWMNIIHQTNTLYNLVCAPERLKFHGAGWTKAGQGPEFHDSNLHGTNHLVYRMKIVRYEAKGCVLELSSDLAEEDIFYVDFENPESVLEVIRRVFWLADLQVKSHPSKCLVPCETRSGVVYSRV